MDDSQNRAQTKPADKETVMPEKPRPAQGSRSRPAVPTPWSVRWREFRVSVMPMFVFLGAIGIAVVCWQNIGTNTGISGVGEGLRSTISSPFAATLRRVLVQPYQTVEAGDPVAIVIPNDPRVELDLLQAELTLARLQFTPSIAEENAMNFEQIRVDLLQTKADLAIAKVNLELAQNQVRRNTPLFKEKLVSEDIYDISLKTRDMFAVEVFEKSNAVAQIEKRVFELETLGIPQAGITNSLMLTTIARLRTLQDAVATNWGPITLTAPISGMITSIPRRDGESLIAGEPVIGISSPHSDRVVGYLRQPYTVQPEIGMAVAMTTRERHPRRFMGLITEIGAQVEIITNALAFVRPGLLVDAGLPVIVSLQDGAQIRPGEIVDLSFHKPRATDTGSGRNDQQALVK